ncbi:hypothetical protein ACQPXB_44545 [Amycolatopsis sp. CA-161197]|uniref:hypothetical protein n=1 Tax=Amycolatopsis sp. CA-161197 TaxID=3239922 RepID=UPI003D8B7ED5
MLIDSRAFPYPFREVPWPEIAVRFREMGDRHPEFAHMADIVDSVLECDGASRLAGLTSMHDLIVTPRPVPDRLPVEVVVVRSPSSGFVGAGGVFIEHRSYTGYDDRIYRPSSEAVPLFWRFMIEKFAVAPVRTGRISGSEAAA